MQSASGHSAKLAPVSISIEPADPRDCDAILKLFPRLASFELPNGRNPDHLWGGDAEMLRNWASVGNDDCIVHVAKESDGTIVGVTMVTLRPELLSHSSSAHLEAIAVAVNAEGRGVGKALLEAAEAAARERGALSMSLHVFASNVRARRVYERAGYDEELIRCIKSFTSDALS
jgi:ribosomal protein S18 acetylase RimI-like enzyme